MLVFESAAGSVVAGGPSLFGPQLEFVSLL